MALTDLTLSELEGYRPDVPEPQDLDAFWSATLATARAAAGAPRLAGVDTPITEFVVEDLTHSGFGGEPIRSWVTRPRREGPLPAVIEYLGYNGGRGLPGERLQWATAGYVHVVMDTRGQGSGWGGGGTTEDPHGSGPSVPGFMTRGIADPETYYYRRVFTDAVLLVDAVRSLPFVDPDRVAITGGSQGGGISLAVAGLAGDAVRACMPDVPFLCHFRRAVEMTPQPPFTEIGQYLSVHRSAAEQVFRTLSYFDGAVLGRRARVPALFSVALMDDIVLPSTVFAAYHGYGSRNGVEDREIEVYPYNGHEGGQMHQWLRQTSWLGKRL